MRDVLDCGVLLAPGHETTMDAWTAGVQARLTRVRLHPVPLSPQACATGTAPPPDSLARLALSLRRYDGCILPVAPHSLAWARMALQEARSTLATPILLLIHDVKAPAIQDLLTLGAADFIAQPVCLESMRVRLGRLARRGAALAAGMTDGFVQARADSSLTAGYPSHVGAARHLHHAMHAGNSPHLADASRAANAKYTAPAFHATPSRPRVSAEIVEQALSSLRHHYKRAGQETFRAAKAQVVNGFEREYIRHALARHGGNVAQAARACAKHRRAFWALMRKHGIDAAPYRQAALAAGRLNGDGPAPDD